jgi:cytochrome c oxidase accessory protein FixG
LTLERLTEKLLKHWTWLMIAWWTGGAWVLYFADAPSLVVELATAKAPMVAYASIAILTFTTYVLAGYMREQVCLYMCPWPRIQAALIDENALNVTYRYDRGEPRQSVKKAAMLRAAGEPAGDCIDCNQCVAVCPTGVDIRDGANLGCIQCGLCIDACDAVMTKIGRTTRLIAYDTDMNIKRRQANLTPVYRFVRPRTILYAAFIVTVSAFMFVSLLGRSDAGVSVIHDRNPLSVRLSDGGVRNGYTIRLVNKQNVPVRFTLSLAGLEGAKLDVIGGEQETTGRELIEVGADQTREVRVTVAVRNGRPGESTPIRFDATREDGSETISAHDFFRMP